MTPHDQSNLNFLMSLQDETSVRDWFSTQSSDDIMYALSLLYAAQDKAQAEEPITDLTQASELLARFTL